MKKVIILLLLSACTLFAQYGPMKDKFYLGYMNSMYNGDYVSINQYLNYEALNINFMQSYGNHKDVDNTHNEGGFKDALTGYEGNVYGLIHDWSVNLNSARSLYLEREKILRGAYGQKSDYEAEMTSPSSHHPGYGYINHQVGSSYGPDIYGASGIKCLVNPDAGTSSSSTRYVVSGLYDNEEQCERIKEYTTIADNTGWEQDYYYSDVKTSTWKWFVLPRMRINSSDAGTQKRIVRIEVYAFNSVSTDPPIDSFTIFADNFKQGGSYSGEYRDVYYDQATGNPLAKMSFSAVALNAGNTTMDEMGRSTHPWDSNVDYRVYWWGDADVYLDKVILEDEWAFFLFHPAIDSLQTTPYYFDAKIQEEVQSTSIGSYSNFAYFYMDEYMYNRIPCIAEVNRQIKSWRSDCGLVAESNISLISNYSGLRYSIPYDDVFSQLYSSGAVTDVLYIYQYPFGQFKTYEDAGHPENDIYTYTPLPPGVSVPSPSTYPGTGNFYNSFVGTATGYHLAGGGSTGDKDNYDDSLNLLIQNDFKSGFGWQISVIDEMRRGAELTKLHSEVALSYGVQQHTYEDPLLFSPHLMYGSLREPTNEEIRMQYYLGIAYNVRHIPSYAYYSYQPGTNYYSWGMIGVGSNYETKRTSNYYLQDKWDSVASLNSKTQKLGDYLQDYNWQAGYSAHIDGSNHSFVQGITSIDPYKSGYNSTCYLTSPGYWGDCPDRTYWEMSFFTPKASTNNGKYVMLVNRRCTPCSYSSGGDIRYLRLKFNSSSLTGYSTWKLTDVLNPRNPKYFLASYSSAVDLGTLPGDPGYFLPGEGKLFKIEPVITGGGTLLADEVIDGQTITCTDTVWNNGYNITFKGNANTISFSDSAAIIMSGGIFQTDSASDGPQTTKNTFQAAVSGHKWKGVICAGTNVKVYNAKFQDVHSSDTGSYSLNCINCPLSDIRYNTFISSDTSNGGLNITYTNAVLFSSPPNSYVNYNTFTMNDSRYNAVQVQGFGGLTAGVYIENNTMTSNGYATGIFLSTITGGVIKNNSIKDTTRVRTYCYHQQICTAMQYRVPVQLQPAYLKQG